jgi:hypothetical protein
MGNDGRFEKALTERILIMDELNKLNKSPLINTDLQFISLSMGDKIEESWSKLAIVTGNKNLSDEHKILQSMDILKCLQQRYDEFIGLAMEEFEGLEDFLYEGVKIGQEPMH